MGLFFLLRELALPQNTSSDHCSGTRVFLQFIWNLCYDTLGLYEGHILC